MVDEFTTTDQKYSFTINGKAHTLPAVTFAQIESFSEERDTVKRVLLMHDILFTRAPKRTADAIRSLTPAQVGDLFRRYTGMMPGESSASSE